MSSPQEKLRRQLKQTPALWGRGPVSYDYGRWVDHTHHILITIFGENSPQETAFLEIVGEGAEARGWGLPLAPANPWGMQARLRRCEEYLQTLMGAMEKAS